MKNVIKVIAIICITISSTAVFAQQPKKNQKSDLAKAAERVFVGMRLVDMRLNNYVDSSNYEFEPTVSSAPTGYKYSVLLDLKYVLDDEDEAMHDLIATSIVAGETATWKGTYYNAELTAYPDLKNNQMRASVKVYQNNLLGDHVVRTFDLLLEANNVRFYKSNRPSLTSLKAEQL